VLSLEIMLYCLNKFSSQNLWCLRNTCSAAGLNRSWDYVGIYFYTDSNVYMESEDKRDEYVLNETGMIWSGTNEHKGVWHWNFAQVC